MEGDENVLNALPLVGRMYLRAGAGGMRMYLPPCPWWGECTHMQGGRGVANVLTALPLVGKMYPWAGWEGDENVLTTMLLVGRMYPWAGQVGGSECTYCPTLCGQNVPMGRAGCGMRIYFLPCPWWGKCTHGQGGLGDANILTALPLVGRMYPWAGRVGG